MRLTQITEKGIKDGEIINADINASAAIDVSKLSGVLPLAGGTLTGDLTISNTAPSIALIDTDSNSDFSIFGSQGEFRIRDQTNTTNRLVINSSGNVGIGTSSPGYKLEVVDASVLLKLNSSNEGNYDVRFVYQNSEANIWSYSSSDLTFGTRFARKLHLVTNGPQKRVTIDDGGNVGIGTTSPAKKLHVYEAGVATIQLETGDSRGQAFNILSTNGAQNNTGTLSIRNEASQSFIDFSHNEGSPKTTISNTGSVQFRFDSDGLKFGSDTAAANALDDYEIGSWSPTIDSGTFTQYNQAWYIKVGKLVTCYFYIYNFSDNSSSTNFVVGGLPYAYNNSPKHESFCDVQHGGAGASFPSGVIGISGRIGQGTSTELELIIRYHNGTPRYMRHEDLGSVHLHTTFSYEAA